MTTLLILVVLTAGRQTAVASTPEAVVLPGICSQSDRFGFSTEHDQILHCDPTPLYAGWYHNFGIWATPPHPADMAYAQTIRISQGPRDEYRACSPSCPMWTDLVQVIVENPGALWFIGSEPDQSTVQDNVTPARYAEIYAEIYSFLKERDPTCLVGIGGVVQPTPIRLLYLDLILQEYRDQNNGAPMPIDVWNTHNYVLREKLYPPPGQQCDDCYGAGIPPGITATYGITVGILYDYWEHDQLDPCDPVQFPWVPHCADKIGWKQQLINLRQFMAERGYRDRPLVISEYGILMPAMYNFPYARVETFMRATFDWLLNTTDSQIGYPSDGNHLVQAWNWYPFVTDTFGGYPLEANLLYPTSALLTPVGAAFRAYTELLTTALPGTVDLKPLSVQDGPPVPDGNGHVNVTITADIQNKGAVASGSVLVGFERDGSLVRTIEVPSIAPGEIKPVHDVWLADLNDVIDAHLVVTATQVVECNPYNNSISARLRVFEHEYFLPLVGRQMNH
jgi:hypothetical protein